jgi:hypothetical protein
MKFLSGGAPRDAAIAIAATPLKNFMELLSRVTSANTLRDVLCFRIETRPGARM